MQLVTPQNEIYQQLQQLGWTLDRIDFRNGQYVAKGSNKEAGLEAERTGNTPEQALLGVFTHAQRAQEIRRFAALKKLGAWQTDWLGQKEEIAKAYREAPAFDAKALDAWRQLALESAVQADAIRRQVQVQVVDEPEPYGSAKELRDDVRQNQKIMVSRADVDHPVWSPADVINFRLVHDVLGYVQSGGDFSWRGENMAVATHAPLLSELAQEALFVECIARAAYSSQFRGLGPDKVVLLTEFLDPVRAEEGVQPWVPHGGTLDQVAQEQEARAAEDRGRERAVYDQEMQKNTPPAPVFELPSVTKGWKAKPAPQFKMRSNRGSLVDPSGEFEGLPGIGAKLRDQRGQQWTVADLDIGYRTIELTSERGARLQWTYDAMRDFLADGVFVPEKRDVPVPEEGGEWQERWPDTLPWGEDEQQYYREAAVYDWAQDPGWRVAMPVVRPQYVDQAVEQFAGPGELHEDPSRSPTGIYCQNPKCTHEMTSEELEEANYVGAFECPECGYVAEIDPWAEVEEGQHQQFTRAGLGLTEMGHIGEQTVLGQGTIPGLGTFEPAHTGGAWPIDAILVGEDGTRYGVEIKSNHSQAQERFKVGSKKARNEKLRYCTENGLTPALLGVRLNFYTDQADVFFRPGLTDTWIGNSQMSHVGTFDFSELNPFQAPTPEEKEELVNSAQLQDQSLSSGDEDGGWVQAAVKRDPDYIWIWYKSELRIEKWDHNRRHADMIDELFDEFGRDFSNEVHEVDPSEVAAGLVYEYSDGSYKVEHEQMNDPEVRDYAEKAIEGFLGSWIEVKFKKKRRKKN